MPVVPCGRFQAAAFFVGHGWLPLIRGAAAPLPDSRPARAAPSTCPRPALSVGDRKSLRSEVQAVGMWAAPGARCPRALLAAALSRQVIRPGASVCAGSCVRPRADGHSFSLPSPIGVGGFSLSAGGACLPSCHGRGRRPARGLPSLPPFQSGRCQGRRLRRAPSSFPPALPFQGRRCCGRRLRRACSPSLWRCLSRAVALFLPVSLTTFSLVLIISIKCPNNPSAFFLAAYKSINHQSFNNPSSS